MHEGEPEGVAVAPEQGVEQQQQPSNDSDIADACPMCYNEFDGVKTIQFGCGHRHCSSCAVGWINQGHDNCPYCTQRVVDRTTGLFRRAPTAIHRLHLILATVFDPLANFADAFFTPLLQFAITCGMWITRIFECIVVNLRWILLAFCLFWVYQTMHSVRTHQSTVPLPAAAAGTTTGEDITRVMSELTRIVSPLMSNATQLLETAIGDIETKHAASPHHPVFVIASLFKLIEQCLVMWLRLYQLVLGIGATLDWPTSLPVDWEALAPLQPVFVVLRLLYSVVVGIIGYTVTCLNVIESFFQQCDWTRFA